MWPFNRSLESVLNATKTVSIMGVKFKIKKIDMTNFLDGSKVMLQIYDLYKVGSPTQNLQDKNMDKIKDHFRDIFMSGVIEPKLTRKTDEPGTYVDNLFTDWNLANGLYSEIVSYTYGKKKLK